VAVYVGVLVGVAVIVGVGVIAATVCVFPVTSPITFATRPEVSPFANTVELKMLLLNVLSVIPVMSKSKTNSKVTGVPGSTVAKPVGM
jgi:hypothetical protein